MEGKGQYPLKERTGSKDEKETMRERDCTPLTMELYKEDEEDEEEDEEEVMFSDMDLINTNN